LSRKKRLFYSVLSVVIGIMTVIGVLSVARANQDKIYAQLEKYGPNLSIIPLVTAIDTKAGNLSLGTLSVGDNYIPESEIPRIREITDGKIKSALDIEDEGNIATIAPRLYVSSELNGIAVMFVGVDPMPERAIRTWWGLSEGTYIESGNQVMLGATAAQLLGLKAGDSVDVDGRNTSVTGVLEESGGDDDYQVFMPLSTLQSIYGKEGLLSSIDIRALCNSCPVQDIATTLNSSLPNLKAVAVKQVAEAEMGVMERINRFMLSLAGVTLVVGLLAVVNTMMTSIHERTKDIGIMRSVGASRKQIITILTYEAIIVGILGGLVGYALGTLLAALLGPLIFDGIKINFIPMYTLLAIGLATGIAVLASLFPAIKATRIKVSDSFRSL